MLPPTPAALVPARWTFNRVLRAATIATLPHWMRELGGLRQPRLVDALVTPLMRVGFRLVEAAGPRGELLLLGVLSPSTVSVAAPVLHEIPARNPATMTPAQARERFGYSKPADAHREWRERQVALMLAGKSTSDDGLIESQAVLGALA
jgi:hypothetical protein